jgi:hypothetical protein
MKTLTSKLLLAAALLLAAILVIPAVSLSLPARGTPSLTNAARTGIIATSVPEAVSLLLLGASLAGLGAVVRRRVSAKRNS